MNRQHWETVACASFWLLMAVWVIAFWLIFGQALIAMSTARPAECRGLNASECTARAEGGW